MLKPLLFVSPFVLSALIFTPLSGSMLQDAATSPVPHADSAQQNPVKPTLESQARAKRLYTMECAMCEK